jgi:DNA-binding NarL/FixJ family response regulator
MVESIGILIVDDHAPFRAGLRALLSAAPDIEVLGEAATGAAAIQLAAELQPDVILMDVQMPGMSGIEAMRDILAASPHIGVLMLTMFEDDDLVFAALRAGGRGYLLKGALKAEILRAVRSVHSGEAIFGAPIATHDGSVPRTYGPRARNPRTHRAVPQQSGDRRALGAVAQDRAQPRVEHLQQDASGGSHSGDLAGAGSWAGRCRTAVTHRSAPLNAGKRLALLRTAL